MKVLIWGIGINTEMLLRNNIFDNESIIGFVDTYKNLRSGYETAFGKTVYSPMDLDNKEYDFIYVASSHIPEIYETCLMLHLDMSKIIFNTPIETLYTNHKIYDQLKECVSKEFYGEFMHRCKMLVNMHEQDYNDMNSSLKYFYDKSTIYEADYFRYRTFELIADLIYSRNLEGSIAELGVFQGDFAALINMRMPDKMLYLFDTFEGFQKEESEYELEAGRINGSFLEYFKKTNEQSVLEKMQNASNVTICKGYFPESCPAYVYDVRFVFVSIDVDFEKSALNGLRFFYPRLSHGGFIMLHDYNHNSLKGVKEAVRQYEHEIEDYILCVPIADQMGTLVITR